MQHEIDPMRTDWHAAARKLSPEGRAFIDGAYVAAADGTTFACVDPATLRHVADVARCKSEDVDRAVRAARAAFAHGEWSRRTPRERKVVLQKLAGLMGGTSG